MILHRGEQFGIALGEIMIRQPDQHACHHSIEQLDRLLSKRTCCLMRQHAIQTVEDLVRLFRSHGSHHFTHLMINLFDVDPWIVKQFVNILMHQSTTLA
jgi:hypothetical protein